MKRDQVIALLFILFLGALLLLYQCKKSEADTPANPGTPSQPANEVWIQSSSFSPSALTVPVNTTVKWINKDGMAHTVTSTSGTFDSGTLNSNATYTYQFRTAGTYPYRCTLHSNMSGTIVVQ